MGAWPNISNTSRLAASRGRAGGQQGRAARQGSKPRLFMVVCFANLFTFAGSVVQEHVPGRPSHASHMWCDGAQGTVPDRLTRWTRNAFGSARMGSNSFGVDKMVLPCDPACYLRYTSTRIVLKCHTGLASRFRITRFTNEHKMGVGPETSRAMKLAASCGRAGGQHGRANRHGSKAW